MEQSEQTPAQGEGTEHALTRRTALAGLAAAGAGAMLGGPTVTALAGSLPAQGEQTQMAAQGERTQMAARPTMGFVLWHEQFPGPELVRIGTAAERAGFDAVWTSDHFQPWQANDGMPTRPGSPCPLSRSTPRACASGPA